MSEENLFNSKEYIDQNDSRTTIRMNDCYNSQLLCHISSVTHISGTKRQAYHRSPTEYWWIIMVRG
ncbi:MAG: hypothetical protein U9N63_12160, partial [Pseudomonadota bacterium]|nr:hypothetical protein [Pseudomonadota bacterium]